MDKSEVEGYHITYYAHNRYLDLSGNQSQIFSYLFSFTMNGVDEDGYCFASRERMSRDLNISMSTLDQNLKKLLDRRLIRKSIVTSRNHAVPMYCANLPYIQEILDDRKKEELKKSSIERTA